MSKGGVLLKSSSALVRILQFLCAALILGIFSYFLAYLTHHHSHIPKWMKAVEGISGAAALYTAFAVILVCFLGGITLFAFLGLFLDVLFCGAFIAIAILTRGAAKKCSGSRSPLGNNRIRDCRFETAVFAVAIVGALLFLFSAAIGILLNRNHKKEKKFGPGPSNNYTSGTGKKSPFWKRQSKKKDVELGAMGTGAVVAEEKHHQTNHKNTIRPSHDTAMTGSTAAPPDGGYGGPNNKYLEPAAPVVNSEHQTHHSSSPSHAYNTVPESGYESRNTPTRDHHVIHDTTQYAEVHHGGFPHTHPESGMTSGRY